VRDVAAQFGSRSPRRVSITTVGLRPTDPIGQQTGQDVDCAEWVKFFELAWDAPGSEFRLAACAVRMFHAGAAFVRAWWTGCRRATRRQPHQRANPAATERDSEKSQTFRRFERYPIEFEAMAL
jgi:hypothetical protein